MSNSRFQSEALLWGFEFPIKKIFEKTGQNFCCACLQCSPNIVLFFERNKKAKETVEEVDMSQQKTNFAPISLQFFQ
jgi:hypothetical protein